MESPNINDRSNVLEQMNDFLSKKDDLFAAREKKIQEQQEQLKSFEQRLIKQATELKEEKDALQKEREKFMEEVAQKEKEFNNQQAQLNAKWQEVYDYEASCQEGMTRLVAEALKEQMAEMKDLEKQLQNESDISDTSGFSQLKSIMAELEGVVTEAEEKNSSMLESYEIAAKNIFPNGYVADKKSHLLCIKVGTRELRIFAGDNPEIHIVENKKNGKQMDSEVIHLNRLQTEWSFSFKENHLIAVRSIEESSAPESVLRQTKKAMSEYFK